VSEPEFIRVPESSPAYQVFRRLYELAHELRPGSVDLWNGELYARTDDKWGGLAPNGAMRLSRDKVLRHLENPGASSRKDLADALATILHESYHARSSLDAPDQPNAVRGPETRGLDEGFTELVTVMDFDSFAKAATDGKLILESHEYAGAVAATRKLLEYATDSQDDKLRLLDRAFDQPAAMRWDVIADHLVQHRLSDVVPPDARHQQAARAHLISAMAIPDWNGIGNRGQDAGELLGADVISGLDRATARLREHYTMRPDQPIAAMVPNPQALRLVDGERPRAMAAPPRRSRARTPSGPGRAKPVGAPGRDSAGPGLQRRHPTMRFLADQAPAAAAVACKPELGDGARGRSGTRANVAEQTQNQGPKTR
jgi:hypothetical protein